MTAKIIKMDRLPKLNLPPSELRVKRLAGGDRVWDQLRGKWLELTPEEWVRRHVINYFTDHLGCCARLIVQEYPIELNRQPQRADIVLFDSDNKPLILVECKAPDVAIDDSVLAQAVRYNSVVQASQIMLTNGIEHYVYKLEEGGYLPAPELVL